MRLDKYLKVSRIIKRRTLAKEICDSGKVTINGNRAKASSDVSEGDELELTFGENVRKVRVLKVVDRVPANQADSLYEYI